MHHNYHYVGILFRLYAVDVFLNPALNKVKAHAAPELFREPGINVGVAISENGHLEPGFIDDGIFGEVGFAVIGADRISAK